VPLILGIWAQAKVTGAFRKYSQIRASSGLTGAQAAREIMDAAQIHDVDIVQINGMLGDHYDPTQKRLCLSTETYNSPSIAAVGVAAHETGHAIQHARAYAPLQLRMAIVPVTQIASRIIPYIFIAGFLFGLGMITIKIGILCFVVLTAFQLITLPVEYDASRRAKIVLGQLGIIQPGAEAAGVDAVLDAAALTYLAAFIASLGQLLWLLSLNRRR
jgi:Zn-dependent membrane protease YugP